MNHKSQMILAGDVNPSLGQSLFERFHLKCTQRSGHLVVTEVEPDELVTAAAKGKGKGKKAVGR